MFLVLQKLEISNEINDSLQYEFACKDVQTKTYSVCLMNKDVMEGKKDDGTKHHACGRNGQKE